MWTELSDTAILTRLGNRIREYRIARELKQSDLAEESGVGLSTIRKIENGLPVSVLLLISVLRTLDLLENLDLLVPETRITPLQLLKFQGRKVQRVRTSKDSL